MHIGVRDLHLAFRSACKCRSFRFTLPKTGLVPPPPSLWPSGTWLSPRWSSRLCPKSAATWRGNPHLPAKGCKFLSVLMAHLTEPQAASTLHAMALLHFYQAGHLESCTRVVQTQELAQQRASPCLQQNSLHAPSVIQGPHW